MSWEWMKDRLFRPPSNDYQFYGEMNEREMRELEKESGARLCKKCRMWMPLANKECPYCGEVIR